MTGVLETATTRTSVVLATLVGALVALLLPSLLTTASHAAGSVTIALLVLAIGALVHASLRRVALAARTRTSGTPTRDDSPPVLADRATDPVHHPLRPRAPGLA